jgi:transcriptional regulator with XRE-family HTH domain
MRKSNTTNEIAPGDRLRRVRLGLGMKHAAFAAKIGVSRPYLAQLEAGKRDGTWGTWVSIADKLGIPTDWLLAGIGRDPVPASEAAAPTAKPRRTRTNRDVG